VHSRASELHDCGRAAEIMTMQKANATATRRTANAMARPSPAPSRGGLLQRKCACGTRTHGGDECAECAREKRAGLQRMLAIGASNDPLEAEADRVAERVVSASTAPERASLALRGQTTFVDSMPVDAPPIVAEVLRSPALPLDGATRAYMEPRFGFDFSHIRLHADTHAAESARIVNAVAYAVGPHIVFDTGSYAPQTSAGRLLLAHELVHTLQQSNGARFPARRFDGFGNDQAAVGTEVTVPRVQATARTVIARQERSPDEPPTIERNFELDPQMFLRPMESRAEPEKEKCEEFPGGSTDCEVDQKTGTPTGKVTHRIDEANPCTRPCVEQHEAVHVRQLKKFCPELRDCYLAADKGTRPVIDCIKMAINGSKERECEAYKVSVPCIESRLKHARECQSSANKDYGARKLDSERCFRDKNCGRQS
jgi:hypothetical protein